MDDDTIDTKECCKRHGYIFNSDDESDSKSSSSDFDDEYDRWKPPPLELDQIKGHIIKICSPPQILYSTAVKNKDSSEYIDPNHISINEAQKGIHLFLNGDVSNGVAKSANLENQIYIQEVTDACKEDKSSRKTKTKLVTNVADIGVIISNGLQKINQLEVLQDGRDSLENSSITYHSSKRNDVIKSKKAGESQNLVIESDWSLPNAGIQNIDVINTCQNEVLEIEEEDDWTLVGATKKNFNRRKLQIIDQSFEEYSPIDDILVKDTSGNSKYSLNSANNGIVGNKENHIKMTSDIPFSGQCSNKDKSKKKKKNPAKSSKIWQRFKYLFYFIYLFPSILMRIITSACDIIYNFFLYAIRFVFSIFESLATLFKENKQNVIKTKKTWKRPRKTSYVKR